VGTLFRSAAARVAGVFALALVAGLSLASSPAQASITEFPLPAANSDPNGITSGLDGALWFTEDGGSLRVGPGPDMIGRITPTGTITQFPLPVNGGPYAIAAGPDGNLWFTEYFGNKIGRITPTGTITEFTVPSANSFPDGIAAGPDGNLWFTESTGGKIGRITPTGTITEFQLPSASSEPDGIAAGPDGNLWFTEGSASGGNKIGRITTAGTITEFSLPTATSEPDGIAAGSDGNLWFTEGSGKIGRITTAGTITEFTIPTATSAPGAIAAGSDGNLWFTETSGNKIGRITTAGTITEFTIPTATSEPEGITSGPDGALWFTETIGNKIGRITPTTTGTGTGPTGKPVNTGLPVISGTAKAGKSLSCSTGSWTQTPTGFAYGWGLSGTPIQGASKSTYKVAKIDEGLTLTCNVTASNSIGSSSPATSKGVKVPVPHVAKCPGATGRLDGTTLGLVKLGMTRKQARSKYKHSSNRGKKYEDFFCLTPIGVRVGYASPKLLDTLPKAKRAKFKDRVIWASTSSAFYTLKGVRAGATVKAASKKLKTGKPFHIGKNVWYLARNGSSTAVLKVRQGIVEEIGIGDKALTTGHKAQVAFLNSFS
jgi:streptogramin lyase